MMSAYLQAASQRFSSISVGSSSGGGALLNASKPWLMMAYPLCRRTAHPLYYHTSSHHSNNPRLRTTLERYTSNYARLYARRMLELAAAAAIAQRMAAAAQMEAAPATIQTPNAWENFSKRDWSDEMHDTLGRTKMERFYRSTKRLINLSLLASPFCVLLPLSYLNVSSAINNMSWEYAIWAIEQSGPTYIKLVQWATTRQDLFSPEFCCRFGRLRDNTRGHSWKATNVILEKELGANWQDILKMDVKPIGSGCIAQVYRAILKQDAKDYPKGTEVAVKVQHPGIWTKVCVDFYLLGKAANFLEGLPYLHLEYLSMRDSVHQFLNVMLPQLDLRLEAKHLRRFNKDFANDDSISFPFPLEEMTTAQVLTETYCDGQPIMSFVDAPKEDREQIARLGLETVLKMIFLNDFVHGDLHPGNILVGRDKKGKLCLRLLDCGLVLEMGPDQHINLTRVLGAFTRKDGERAGQLMIDNASKVQASDLDVELFVKGIRKIIQDDENNNFMEKVGDYIADICFLACKHRVKLEASFINAALAVEIVEGIASTLYPNMSVQSMALPMVVKAEMMHRLPTFNLKF